MVEQWEQIGGTGNSVVEQCDGTMWNSVAVRHSVVEQKKSVMEQCEQSGIVCWNSGTVYDGTVEQCEQCRTVSCC